MATSHRHNSVTAARNKKRRHIVEERNLLRHPSCVVALGLLSLVGVTAAAEAGMTSIVINIKTSPAFGGQSFGSVGQYEQLDRTASGEIDPKDPLTQLFRISNWRRGIPAEWSSIRWISQF
jgi:hypothetical protein